MFRFNWEGTHYIKIWLLRVCCGSSQWFIVVVACEILIVVMLSSDTTCGCRASFSSPQNTCRQANNSSHKVASFNYKIRDRKRTLSRIRFYIVWLWLCCRTLELKHTNTTSLLLFNVAENYSEWILATSALKGETLDIQFYSIEASGFLYFYKIIKE